MVTIPAAARVTITPATNWELDLPAGAVVRVDVPSTRDVNRYAHIDLTAGGQWLCRVKTGDSYTDPWGKWDTTTVDTLDEAAAWCHSTMARGYASIRWD